MQGGAPPPPPPGLVRGPGGALYNPSAGAPQGPPLAQPAAGPPGLSLEDKVSCGGNRCMPAWHSSQGMERKSLHGFQEV